MLEKTPGKRVEIGYVEKRSIATDGSYMTMPTNPNGAVGVPALPCCEPSLACSHVAPTHAVGIGEFEFPIAY